MKLEICIDSLESAKNAVDGSCDQLEVCSALVLGGLTPSAGLVYCIQKDILPNSRVKMMIMIRPRDGNFLYNRSELDVMKSEIELFSRQYPEAGFVLGILKENNTLDVDAIEELLNCCENRQSREFTLHRAFDLTSNWIEAVDLASQLGFANILTSGQKPTAMEGKELLAEIIEYAKTKGVQIIVGSGVKSSNISELWQTTKASAYHGSAAINLPTNYTSPIPMGPAESNTIRVTSKEEVIQIRKKLSEIIENKFT